MKRRLAFRNIMTLVQISQCSVADLVAPIVLNMFATFHKSHASPVPKCIGLHQEFLKLLWQYWFTVLKLGPIANVVAAGYVLFEDGPDCLVLYTNRICYCLERTVYPSAFRVSKSQPYYLFLDLSNGFLFSWQLLDFL